MRRNAASVVLLIVAMLILGPRAAVAADADGDVNSLGLTATYDVAANFSWTNRTVSVETSAIVTNATRWTAGKLAFNLATLRTGRATVNRLTVDGAPVEPTVDDQTLIVNAPAPLAPGASVSVFIAYDARLNASTSPEGDAGEFALIDDVLTAYRWIPWLSRTTPFDRPNVGDPFVTANSPRIHVEITSDRDAEWATSGVEAARLGTTRAFDAENVRDFNLAASPSYRARSANVGDTKITFFHRTLPPDEVLATAARALRSFGERVGTYPYPELTIAEIGRWAPFESPAHFWLPSDAPPRLLSWMVAHEVAHQWFYAVVGNDQAREPFADEAVADYMARTLVNRFADTRCPTGRLDPSIYDIGDCYAWVVYVQGVDWFRELPEAAVWQALRDYYDTHRWGLGDTRSVLGALAAAGAVEPSDLGRFPSKLVPLLRTLPVGRLLI